MTDIYGRRVNQPISWFHRKSASGNQYCPYCGVFVGAGSEVKSNKEHLIGREFVPSGSLGATGFNFHFRVCCQCNVEKSDAEGLISSITLFNTPARFNDPQLNSLAKRKAAGAYHPDEKDTLVKDASANHLVEFGNNAFQMRCNLTSPPRLPARLVSFLAYKHIQGLFSLMTSSDPREKTRLLPHENIHVFDYYNYLDWGNTQLAEVNARVRSWPCYANICAAEGYFRALLRRCVDSQVGWFWALEWNRSLRVIGAIAQPQLIPQLFRDLPELHWTPFPDGSGRFREEVRMPEEQDTLFDAEVVGFTGS